MQNTKHAVNESARVRRSVMVGVAIVHALLLGATTIARGAPAATQSPVRPSKPRDVVLIAIPGGRVQIGDNGAQPDERPSFIYDARPLLFDRTPVTVAQFKRFVAETGYVTEAERRGSSSVLDKTAGGWIEVEDVTWVHPFGPKKPGAPDNHPVTQVTWNDATAFCQAYGARLPTEFEWERAARLGQTADGHVFKGSDFVKRGAHFPANVWQGLFPLNDTGEDGYVTTSPVGAFGAAPSGLTDMAGNVWEWTASVYLPYSQRDSARTPRLDDEWVQRGGSFLCDPTLCEGFRATARGHATAATTLPHVGFRCVVDP